VLSRTIYGARVSIVVGFLPTIIILVIGVTIGLISGYAGGKVDNILMRLTDVVYAFPDLLFFIIAMITLRDTWFGQLFNGLALLFCALAVVNWVGVARVVRGQVLSIKEKEFVEAARCVGARDLHIMVKHILPNSLGPVIILTAFSIPMMIITEAILGYLGLGHALGRAKRIECPTLGIVGTCYLCGIDRTIVYLLGRWFPRCPGSTSARHRINLSFLDHQGATGSF